MLMEELESWTGLVTLPVGRGQFRPNGETIARVEQPPQFFPRLEWPIQNQNQNQAIPHTNLPVFQIDLLDGDAAQLAQLHQQVSARYGNLRPMLPFQANANNTYRGWDWNSHVAVLHELLRRLGGRGKLKGLTRNEVMALETICSYGLYDKVAFLNPWELADGAPQPAPAPQQAPPPPSQPARVNPGRNARTATATAPVAGAPPQPSPHLPWIARRHFPEFGEDLAEGDYGRTNIIAQLGPMPLAIEGRRFIVAPIFHGPIWSMSIFDRVNGELYIFDCYSTNRESRVQGIVHLWIQYWNWLGICKTFQYFVPKTHRVAEFADTGYKSILWLFQNIRNQVGQQIQVGNVPRKDVRMVIISPRQPIQDSTMYIHDAFPRGMSSAVPIGSVARRMLTVLLCNELGLAGHREISSGGSRAGAVIPLVLIQDLAGSINTQTTIPLAHYFTDSGGPQIAANRGALFGPYDPNQTRAFHQATANPLGVLIPNQPVAYVTPIPQAQLINWTRTIFYDPANPVSVEGIDPADVQPQDEVDTETYREFLVPLEKTRPHVPNTPLDSELVISFDQISRVNLNNGGVGIRFNLWTQGDSSNPVGTVVDIPVPNGNGNDGGGDDGNDGGGNDGNDGGGNDWNDGGDNDGNGVDRYDGNNGDGDNGNGGSSRGTTTNPNTPRSQGSGANPAPTTPDQVLRTNQGKRASKGPTTPKQGSQSARSRNTSEASTIILGSPSNAENRRPKRYTSAPAQSQPANTGDPGPSQRRRRPRSNEDSPGAGPSKRPRITRSFKSPPGGGGSSGTRAPLAPM